MSTKRRSTARIAVRKARKLAIGGEFPRTESGRTEAVRLADGTTIEISRASRKDVRNAVLAARTAQPGWWKKTPYNRGQILYRAAEMLESRSAAMAELLAAAEGSTRSAARREVSAAVDRLVAFAGWPDKLAIVLGSVNPVAAPFFCFTVPEPVGVVALLAPERPSLLGLVSGLGAILAGGNAVVAVPCESSPLPGLELAEILATSDLPAGTVNILSGRREELALALAAHRDVDALSAPEAPGSLRRKLEADSAENLRRTDFPQGSPKDYFDAHRATESGRIAPFVELKTTWHPIGG